VFRGCGGVPRSKPVAWGNCLAGSLIARSVLFEGYSIPTWQDTSTKVVYVGMRQLCKVLARTWVPQYAQLQGDPFYAAGLRILNRDGRDVIGLSLDRVGVWISNLTPAENVFMRSMLHKFKVGLTQAISIAWK